ncbi:iron chaperone [Okibacterium fritillariae]|uniref:iron chaperone n=1 Tax=Okibacterium fritillariae TaxID=123320 RepID=UPI0040556A2E
MTENFTPEERAAMKERAAEVRKQARKGAKADPEKDLLEKIAEMTDDDRAIAERLHAIVAEHAPALTPKTWYGMPGYALDGKVVVFFQAAAKFKVRYATIGFNDNATLDEGTMWPTAFAVTKLGPDEEAFIGELLRKAVPAP